MEPSTPATDPIHSQSPFHSSPTRVDIASSIRMIDDLMVVGLREGGMLVVGCWYQVQLAETRESLSGTSEQVLVRTSKLAGRQKRIIQERVEE